MSAESERGWDETGYIVSSHYRRGIVETLDDRGPSTPSTLAEQLDVRIAHVSRALQELREREIVALLVSEDTRKGRIYGLTEAGDAAVNHIGEVNGVDAS